MSLIDILRVYEFNKKIRLGVNYDGGYVIADNIGTYDCYISAGVSDEESFSRDFIEKFNMNMYNCYAFDGTITSYPYHYTDKITFIKKNIGNVLDNNIANLSSLMTNFDNIFLKMDIEGSEYVWIEYVSEEQLRKFKQIVIEFHGINDDSWNTKHSIKMDCIRKLSNTHYLIHAHGNNHGGISDNIPDTVELTYVRKDLFTEKPKFNKELLPIEGIDYPNNPFEPDFNLSFSPFLNK